MVTNSMGRIRVQPGGIRRANRSRRLFHALALAMTIALLGACGGQTPSASSSPTAAVIPPDPNLTIWPSDVVNATIALGALDNEMKKAGNDLNTAIDTSDTRLLLGAAEGLAALAEQSIPNAQKLAGYAETKNTGAAYVQVLASIVKAGKALAAALRAGDSPGVATAAQDLGKALGDYAAARTPMVDLVDRAVLMQKHYVR
jgi:hypothetical protein